MKEERKPCLHTLMYRVKWFYSQSERAYYLNYFINISVKLFQRGTIKYK